MSLFPGDGQARVTFTVKCETEMFDSLFNFNHGQTVSPIDEALRARQWDAEKAVEMHTSEDIYPTWKASLLLPHNTTVPYKYFLVKKDEQGHKLWEKIENNRSVETKKEETILVDDGVYEGGVRVSVTCGSLSDEDKKEQFEAAAKLIEDKESAFASNFAKFF
ncbi:hypothetical protein T484DRAFT_1784353 [Baffinella frigidus]|nr:hypothetical protein T484DRAFT_1784353 [Cryptophyta sp. CCMP2293]